MIGRLLPPALVVGLAVASASAGFALTGGVQPSRAAWTQATTVGTTVTAAAPAAVPAVACGTGSGALASAVPISWTAPAGPAPSGYRLHWQGTAGTGDASFATSPGSIGGGNLSVLGSSTVTVYAQYGDWVAPVSLQSRTVTTVAVFSVIVSWTCA